MGLLFQTSENATFANERTVPPEDTTLDGNLPEEADIGDLANTFLLNMTAAGPPNYSCDGRVFGRNLNLQSCVEAMNSMKDFHLPRTYGERGEGYDINLPYRFLSSKAACRKDHFGYKADQRQVTAFVPSTSVIERVLTSTP